LVKEVSVLLECNAEEISNIKDSNEFSFYSLFSINKNEVDSLIREAKSKEKFENAAILILDNLNEYYKKNLLSNDVKNLLFEIKKNHISPS